MIEMQIGPQTELSDKLHSIKYREKGESFREAAQRWAFGLQSNDAHYHKIRPIFLEQRFLPAGRIQAAIGASFSATAFNCYVSGTIADSYTKDKGSIADRLKEAMCTLALGGGMGYDFSTLRPEGDRIKKLGTESCGPVEFMSLFDQVGTLTRAVGHRHGAQMGVMRVDHPDIETFIRVKQNENRLRRFNISIAITDEFMEAVKLDKPFALRFEGRVYREVNAVALWEKIMRSTYDWSEPGVMFIDRINSMNNLHYCETIAATNPCFTADTKVWTVDGHQSFRDLVGKTVQVLSEHDGRFVYRTMRDIRRTQRNAKLVEIKLRDSVGVTHKIRCTPQHVFYLKNGREVMAQDLRKGSRLASVYRRPRGPKSYIGLWSSSRKGMMEHHVPFEGVEGLGVTVDAHHIDEDKTHNHPSNLELKNHGEHSRSHIMGDNNPMRRFPESNHFHTMDQTGDKNHSWRDDVETSRLQELRDAGLGYGAIAKKVGCSKYTVMKRLGWERPNHTVVDVRSLEVREDVYCGTVEGTHKFFISLGKDDGVLVHNCGEQPLPPYGACLLGSFNLVKYLRRKANLMDTFGPMYDFDLDALRADVAPVVEAMDNVIDRTTYPLAEQKAEAITKRRMGLGVTGLANAAEACGYIYGTPEFIAFMEKVLEAIRDSAYAASIELAKTKGAFPLYDTRYCEGRFIQSLPSHLQGGIREHGIRNSHLLSLAPTGTISLCADNVSSSLEPVFCYEVTRPVEVAGGFEEHTITDYGVKFLGVRGRLADDVSPEEHVAVLAAAQKYVDSSISKTVNVDGSKLGWEGFKNVYWHAWEKGAKSCTTFNKTGLRMGLLKAAPKDDVADDEKSSATACSLTGTCE